MVGEQLYGLVNSQIEHLSDVVIFETDFEGALVEALAMNTPVIATRHGGPLDIITEGENGSFFAPNNAEELASLLSAPFKRECGIRREILNEFSLHNMIEGHLEVYKDVATN